MSQQVKMESIFPIGIKINTEVNELYHYTSKESASNILGSSSFWVTESNHLNDKHEINYIKVPLLICIKELEKEKNFETRPVINDNSGFLYTLMLNQFKYFFNNFESTFKNTDSSFFILSLSPLKDNEYLWKEYSKSNGSIIKVNPDYFLTNRFKNLEVFDSNTHFTCGHVVYDIQEQFNILYITFMERYIDFQNIFTREKISSIPSAIWGEFKKILLVLIYTYAQYFKNSHYIDEKEYRVVFSSDIKNNKFIKLRNDGKPYIEFPIELENIELFK